MALWKESAQKAVFSKGAEADEVDFSPEQPLRQELAPQPSRHKESVLAAGLTVEGKIEGEGHVRISGQFKGDIRVRGDLTVESGARLIGEIGAENVTIGGEVEGNVHAAAQVELLASGQLVGDLTATSLTVAAGSRMRGNVEFGWNGQESTSLRIEKSNDKSGNGSSL